MAFFAQTFEPRYFRLGKVLHIQRIGEVELETVALPHFVAELFQQKANFDVANSIRSHH